MERTNWEWCRLLYPQSPSTLTHFFPIRLYLTKEIHQLRIKHSNIYTYRVHSHSNHNREYFNVKNKWLDFSLTHVFKKYIIYFLFDFCLVFIYYFVSLVLNLDFNGWAISAASTLIIFQLQCCFSVLMLFLLQSSFSCLVMTFKIVFKQIYSFKKNLKFFESSSFAYF